MRPQTANEIRSLTGLRGVAAIYVLFFHYFPMKPEALSNPIARIIDHGYLAVDLFFVLSGFVMAMTYGHTFSSGWSSAAYLRFLGRRIARIYPLYVVATLAGFCLVITGWARYDPGAPLVLNLVLNLALVQAWGLVSSLDSPSWSISAEWAAYLIFPALLVPTLFRKPLVGWISALCCAGLLAALCALSTVLGHGHGNDYLADAPLNYNAYWLGLPVLRCIPEFALGILAFRFATSSAGKRAGSNPFIAPVLCIVTIAVASIPRSDLAIVLLFPMLVASLASENNATSRILSTAIPEFVGTLSYSIYLTHKLFIVSLERLATRAQAVGIPHAYTIVALGFIALTFLVAFVAYRTIEAPGRRWLRIVFEGKGNRGDIPARNPAIQEA